MYFHDYAKSNNAVDRLQVAVVEKCGLMSTQVEVELGHPDLQTHPRSREPHTN